ncbi:DNA-binding transcriptional regulator, LysR family [Nakamurella panacisegetis]|uniref:DNA-binding transcriptional regulator, LysR family n=1 Tax=Nakamurella panacisegetis TaxID=1090615 RepID=A0A1H0NIA4_9ACTN|nr:LysR substrate-binding domain-containing protein [Nakamurella panacisegetis]SDO92316.1 DNA-binding transcriptional regulator, LysR family [Nakamurella panacisegetis]
MELRQLEYFVAVAEEANFTRAAERVHISQSGVSAQIRQLEGQLGAELIDRSGRTATLTSAGRAALTPARAALASAEAVRRAVDEVTGVVRGRLTVGMVTACTVTPLFDALADFHRAHPTIELSLVEDNSDVLVDRIRDGRLDLALVGLAGQVPDDLASRIVIRERLSAVVPSGHPLAGRRRIALAELVTHPTICLPRGTGVRAVFDRDCEAQGLHANLTLQASAPDAVVDLAGRGLGVAVLTDTMASFYRDRMEILPITGIRTPALLALVWRRMPNAALDRLLEHAGRAFAPGAASAPRSIR